MWRSIGSMAADSAGRRVRHLLGSLSGRGPVWPVVLRLCSSKAGDTRIVRIGDVSMTIKPAKNPELVPIKYLTDEVPQSLLRHLRWIMQKDTLGQDVFLIGPPGPLRRTLAMMYLEMTDKEVEYVSLSRDTTESDLKQRREIQEGTAYHIDQCAVQAATLGRVLVLEGIEKAERNVLPVLNNLLENREMQLDDGRFLMAATRYDKLLQDHTQEEMDAWKLVRVSEDFRVIALGLPVPRYQGNPLDPPLRSRFQARDINPLPFKDQLEVLKAVAGGVPPDKLAKILSFASTLNSTEANTLGLPDFPVDNLASVIKILSACPSASAQRLLGRLYPAAVMMNKEGQTAVNDAFNTFELTEAELSERHLVTEVRRGPEGATVQMSYEGQETQIKVPCGTINQDAPTSEFVATSYHDGILADLMTSHMVSDFCIVGPRGSGKSVIVKQFADLLGYHMEPIMLYQDMTSRDLLQQRTTLANGDTSWRPSPLVTAALDGSLAVLDGVHRVNAGTFAVIQRLVHDRELTLFDGTRLLRHDRYDTVKEKEGLSDEEMASRSIERIHPSFRVVALSEPPVVGSSSQQWLHSEQLTMFMYHQLRPLSRAEENHVLHKLVPNMKEMDPIMKLTHSLRAASDSNLKSLAGSLSTRQLLRIARRFSEYPDEPLFETVQKACLSRFLPRITRNALEEEMGTMGMEKAKGAVTVAGMDKAITCAIQDGILRIGNTTVPVFDPATKMKVPDVLFYENPQHLAVMEAMLKDYLLGEHLLLVGNQGVGKNKIIDRFLYLLNRPREYLQLHRDTTVQTLTLQPTVQDGVIVYEDSPLVRAVKLGHILVVDEADKAPTNVTCILKTLVESGEMHLADGRRVVSAHSGIPPSESVIVAHPDFRMFVLANRPGFPFLGNDFFGAMGDIFSCHAVDNPDTESEMSMLRQYGPDVPDDILRRLVLAFGELRDMADQGLISYPYSTREVVNMVKHLQIYPEEGLANVVKNVFDFDMYNKDMVETLVTTLQKHGVPVGADPNNIRLAKEVELPKLTLSGQLQIRHPSDRQKTGMFTCPTEDLTLRIKGPVTLDVQSFPLDRTEARSILFSEQEAFWTLPLHETSVIADVGVTLAAKRQKVAKTVPTDLIHVVTSNPVSLYTMDPRAQRLTGVDLYDIFPNSQRGMSRHRFQLAPLGFPLDSNVVLHEEVSNTLLDINVETGEVRRLETTSVLEAAADKILNFRKTQGTHRMCAELCQEPEGLVMVYKQDSQSIEAIMMLEGRGLSIQLPIKIQDLHTLSKHDWVVTESETGSQYLMSSSQDAPFEFTFQPMEAMPGAAGAAVLASMQAPGRRLSDDLLSVALKEKISSPNRVLATKDSYTTLAVGLPELLTIDVYNSPRAAGDDYMKTAPRFVPTVGSATTKPRSRDPALVLPQSGQVVRIRPYYKVPKDVLPEGVKTSHLAGFLEVADVVNHKLRYIPVPGVLNTSYYHQWFNQGSDVNVVMAEMSDDGLVTVDTGGCVRLWETAPTNLDRSLQQWRQLIGEEDSRHLQMTYDRDLGGKEAEAPKHGKVDPTGNPHVGGNQWAGGTGGRDTAGLGGIGGPYRLDAGHDVHQVPQEAKDAVPEHIQKAAREMGLKAWRARLKEIEMSEYDGELYERFAKSVGRQVTSLRVILESMQAKGKERQWLRHQTQGDLDDNKLIEGITGEKAIYRRRGEKEPEMGTPQQKPKYLKVLCDVSGSMYRFNGHDGRLEREMEAMLMVMEALDNYEHKIKYDIIGHSGEGPHFDFVKAGKPPKNNKQRLDVIKTLHAHSQFCISGDHTLEATKDAIEKLAQEEADEHFVIVLSDANLDRYGIRPQRFGNLLTSDEKVNAYVIFIGSLGNQATSLVKQMPAGRAFVCMDTTKLPQILQQIFTSTMLSTR